MNRDNAFYLATIFFLNGFPANVQHPDDDSDADNYGVTVDVGGNIDYVRYTTIEDYENAEAALINCGRLK